MINIGGAGWSSSRPWGAVGAQYKREVLVAMSGEPCVEDRVSGEVFLPYTYGGASGVVARAFAARTTRLVGDELAHDFTAGFELATAYEYRGSRADANLELGRTFTRRSTTCSRRHRASPHPSASRSSTAEVTPGATENVSATVGRRHM